MLLMNCPLRTTLDLLHPAVEQRVVEKYKTSHDSRSQERQFFVGQRVMARNL